VTVSAKYSGLYFCVYKIFYSYPFLYLLVLSPLVFTENFNATPVFQLLLQLLHVPGARSVNNRAKYNFLRKTVKAQASFLTLYNNAYTSQTNRFLLSQIITDY
jgi:hypothetical protein